MEPGSQAAPQPRRAGSSGPNGAEQPGHVAGGLQEGVRQGPREVSGPAEPLTAKGRAEGSSTILVFEGWDAAGKGGAIRRVTAALDARSYQVIPIAAPTDEERAHHYLWRFWRRLSRAGRLTIFNRSWYGRILVERVEGFATERAWRRAYSEIGEVEEQLSTMDRPREILGSHLAGRPTAPLQGARKGADTSNGSSPTKSGVTTQSGPTTSGQ